MHPQGVIVQVHTGFTRRRRGGPGTDPMSVGVHRLSPTVATRVCLMTIGHTAPLMSQAERSHPHQVQIACPMMSALSVSDSHGIVSVNIVTHCRQEHGIFVMSVPQNTRCGPKAS